MNRDTGCPLDCYDACEVSFEGNKIVAKKSYYTQGFLCPHLKHYFDYSTISSARYEGKEISDAEALEILKRVLRDSSKEEILHYRGSGNFGLMQEVTDHFFASFGATLTDGSLCDGAGEAGIIMGRGENKNMPVSEIEKAEVVIFWGRNPHVSSTHLLPMIKDKTVIVIDPIKTPIAQSADLHIQIKPHGDIYLAMLLSRFLYINDAHNETFLEKFIRVFQKNFEWSHLVIFVMGLILFRYYIKFKRIYDEY